MSSNSSSPAPPSDDDAAALYRAGLSITQDNVGVLFETILMSVYGVFFALAVYSIFRKGIKSPTSLVMLLVVVYLYATSLTLWALNVVQWFYVAGAFLLDSPHMPIVDRADFANGRIAALGTPMEALFMFNMVIGDSVVIWRVWALYRRQLWVLSIPCLMLTLSFAFSVLDVTCLTGAGWSDETAVAGGGGVCTHAELISWAFSLVTNASCTGFISVKAWQHRRTMRTAKLQASSSRMSAEKLLSLLVESGFIYCLFWLTQLILFFPVSRHNASIYFYEVLGAMGDQISGLYPTLIIVIVNFQQSIWESADSRTPDFAGGSALTSTNMHTASDFSSRQHRAGVGAGAGADTLLAGRQENVSIRLGTGASDSHSNVALDVIELGKKDFKAPTAEYV